MDNHAISSHTRTSNVRLNPINCAIRLGLHLLYRLFIERLTAADSALISFLYLSLPVCLPPSSSFRQRGSFVSLPVIPPYFAHKIYLHLVFSCIHQVHTDIYKPMQYSNSNEIPSPQIEHMTRGYVTIPHCQFIVSWHPSIRVL